MHYNAGSVNKPFILLMNLSSALDFCFAFTKKTLLLVTFSQVTCVTQAVCVNPVRSRLVEWHLSTTSYAN